MWKFSKAAVLLTSSFQSILLVRRCQGQHDDVLSSHLNRAWLIKCSRPWGQTKVGYDVSLIAGSWMLLCITFWLQLVHSMNVCDSISMIRLRAVEVALQWKWPQCPFIDRFHSCNADRWSKQACAAVMLTVYLDHGASHKYMAAQVAHATPSVSKFHI